VLMASSGYDRERSILADLWRKAGVDVKEQAVSVTQDQDRQFRAAFNLARTRPEQTSAPSMSF